ncbi:MAG: MBL fold metallo-hydrolase [Myxococcales bacterium]|nr:MBL fold metallo-hydrolase [Myxococcales bacterium]
MKIRAFFDKRTWTLTYVVYDPDTRDAVIIDPVLDYDPAASKTWTESVDEVIKFAKQSELEVHYILETHAHADHLSGSQTLKEAFPRAKTAIGEHITDVQALFKKVFDLPADFPTDGRQFDELLVDESEIKAGTLTIKTINTPGHTPACVTYQIGDALFTGDALFMPDQGTGRCDFPGGSAADLYDSLQKIYAMPDEMRVFVGHDYQPGGRELRYETTVGEQKKHNVQLPGDRGRDDFVEARTTRDATLSAPKLLFQSVQVNIDAGKLPDPAANEIRYLRIPINVFRPEPQPQAKVELQRV